MKPIYICVNGHTFDQPITGNIMGVYGGPAVFGCPVCHTEDFEKIPPIITPTYMCVNGHTFNQPLTGSKGGPLDPTIVYGCPTCYTEDFEKIPAIQELKNREPNTKTCVTHLGKGIRGDMMISFKCRLCSCEFESPISECSLSVRDSAIANYTLTGVDLISAPVANHKCPAPYCGVECEVILDKEEIFEE